MGTNSSIRLSSFFLSVCHASSAVFSSLVSGHVVSLRPFLIPSQFAFLQLFTVFFSSSIFPDIFSSNCSITWSLLSSRPLSVISLTLPGMLVSTRSRQLPLMWVGNLTSCSKNWSCSVWTNASSLLFAVPLSQSMPGKLKSPTSRLFFSAVFSSSLRSSVFL